MLANLIKAVLLIFILLVASGAGAEPSDHELRLKVLEEKMEAGAKTREWLDKFSFKNDLRLRHESRFLDKDAAGNNALDQHRERFRLRLGGEYSFDPNLKVGLRLASGGSDPISTNQTMNDAFGKKTVNIDWAYAHYARAFGVLKTQFTGGKFDEPFFRASELVWDYDLTTEGLSEGFTFPVGASTTLFATFGQFAVDESATQQYDPYLTGYQGGVEQKLGPLGKAKAAVAYYDYANVKGKVIPHRKSTNTLTGGGLANDFNIVNVTATWSVDTGVPFKVLGEYVSNVADGVSSQEDTAYLAGFALGNSPRKFGDWLVFYQYRVVERDAVFDAFTHSDFHNGGTNAKGSVMGLKFGLMKGAQFDATYYATRANRGAPVDEDRLQLDAIFKF